MIIEPSRTESFDLVGVNPELFAAVLSLLQDDESPVNVPRTRLAAAGSEASPNIRNELGRRSAIRILTYREYVSFDSE
jgi:hypothetical protein